MSETMLSEKEGQKVTPTKDPTTDPVKDKSQTPPVSRRSGSQTKLVIALALLVAVAAGVYALYMHFRDRVSSDDANVDAHISAIAPTSRRIAFSFDMLDSPFGWTVADWPA